MWNRFREHLIDPSDVEGTVDSDETPGRIQVGPVRDEGEEETGGQADRQQESGMGKNLGGSGRIG